MTKPHYKAVFISPHLDDAVFSCGGQIAHLVQQGPVLVLNLFTGYLSEVKVRAVVLGAERYEEEAAAARFLGFASHNLGELDVSFRREAYRSLGNIFRPPVAEDLAPYLPDLRQRVLAYLEGVSYEQLYVPLGIGWHVDHILAYLIFEPWLGRAGLIHYEDAPYCLIPHATRYRINELGRQHADPQDKTLAPVNALQAWWAAAKGYASTALMKNLKPWPVRLAAVPVVSFYLYRLISLHRKTARQHPPHLTLTPLALTPLPSAAFARKLQAMALYPSQFQEFFAGPQDCARLYALYARQIHPALSPLERYWRITPDQE